MLEYSPTNGEVCFVVPGKVLLFRPPCGSLPAGTPWEDRDGERHFSPAFYADLLSHLGARVVLRCDGAEYDPGPFLDAGMAVEPLGRGPSGEEEEIVTLQVRPS